MWVRDMSCWLTYLKHTLLKPPLVKETSLLFQCSRLLFSLTHNNFRSCYTSWRIWLDFYCGKPQQQFCYLCDQAWLSDLRGTSISCLIVPKVEKEYILTFVLAKNTAPWWLACSTTCSLLDIGWGKLFHPHRLPLAFHEWNWHQSLSSPLSLVESHQLGTLSVVHRYSGEDTWANFVCSLSSPERHTLCDRLWLDGAFFN